MESEEPFGDEMQNFDVSGTVFKALTKDIDVLDVDAKTEPVALSKNSGWKSTENEQNKGEMKQCHLRRHLYWGLPMMQELDDD